MFRYVCLNQSLYGEAFDLFLRSITERQDLGFMVYKTKLEWSGAKEQA
jgi:hypothetical protein